MTLHVGEVSGELGVQRVGQLVVNRAGQRLFNCLFIADLRDREGRRGGDFESLRELSVENVLLMKKTSFPLALTLHSEHSPGLYLTLQL